MTESEKKGILLAFIGGAAWGLSGTCGQFLFSYTDMSPMTITVFRLLGAGALLTAGNLIHHGKEALRIWTSRKDVLRLLVFAICGLMLCQLSYLTTIRYSNSGTATVLQSTGTVMIFLLTCIWQRRKPKAKEFLCLVLVILGVVLLATHGNLSQVVLSPKALAWGMAAAVAVVFYSLLPGHLLQDYGAPTVLGYAMLIGGLFLSLLSRIWQQEIDVRPLSLLGIIFMVVIGTALAFSCYLMGVQHAGARRASIVSCDEPVVATITAALLLGTQFHAMDLAGFVSILAGVILLSAE